MRKNLFIKNSILQGPQGLSGPQGPQGVVIQTVNAADSATLTNITAATAFSLAWNAVANFYTVGKIVRARWSGEIDAAAGQNITLEAEIGGQGLALPAYTLAAANYNFDVEMEIICRTIGAAGTIQPRFTYVINAQAGSSPITYTVMPTPFTVDTTGALNHQLFMTSTVANNSSKVRNFTVESKN